MNIPGGFNFKDLDGKTLVVTGVTRGIGKALLPFFFDQGMRVVAVGRGKERLEAVRKEFGVGEEQCLIVDCDLGEVEAVQKAGAEILASGWQIDGILNNAAIDPRTHFEQGDQMFWENIFQVNLFSAIALTRLLLPRIKESSQGRVLFTGSVLFELGGGCLTGYVSTKGALEGLTKSLAHELQHTGITVNCVVPGAIAVEKETGTTEGNQRLIQWQTVPRRLVPSDLAGIICLLLSGAGGGMTAQSITVDGGIVHPLASGEVQGKRLNPPWPLTSKTDAPVDSLETENKEESDLKNI